MQMLGKSSANRIPLKKPRMKEGFISKAEVDRLNAKKLEMTPARGTKNFFNPLPPDVSGLQGDARVTNTLTYSDTLYNQTSSAVVGRKTDVSELGTVFGLGTQRNTANMNIELDDDIRKSAHFGPPRESGIGSSDTPERTNFLNSRNEAGDPKQPEAGHPDTLQNNSQLIEQVQFQKEALIRSQKLPSYQASWFHFYTNHVYCSITSLRLEIDGCLFKIPFAIAKLILTSHHHFENFIKTSKFVANGIFEIDFNFIELIKGERIESNTYFTEDSELEIDQKRVGLK